MSRTQLSRTPLSKQTSVLRTSLLLSLGLAPLACGGTVISASDGEGGGTSQAGAPSYGGSEPVAGAPQIAGAPSYGGSIALGGAGPTGGATSVMACALPEFDSVTKLITCANGLRHRAQALACAYIKPPPTGAGGEGGAAGEGSGGEAGSVEFSSCQTNADCASLPRGYCENGGGGFEAPVCRSGCLDDGDCGIRQICACDGITPGRCVSAGCAVDSDCGPNAFCAEVGAVCGASSFQCTSPLDECITSGDCGPKGGGTCAFNGTNRACNNAVCGRPFLVDETPRMAAIETRADWLDASLTPNTSGLTPVQRAQLAAHWARLGQLEHASIAAFARFNLQLLSLGAPSDLVEACNRALADETAHARSCFALASAYGGTAVGPARLDIEHCFEDTSLLAIAKLVLREGCIGETAASLEALAAAEVARDPAVKRTLSRIARDELTHAELAFKFLRWALSLSSADERHELAREAARQLADFESEARNADRSPTDDQLAAHGSVAGEALRAIHLAAVRDVTRPLLATLFDIDTPSPTH